MSDEKIDLPFAVFETATIAVAAERITNILTKGKISWKTEFVKDAVVVGSSLVVTSLTAKKKPSHLERAVSENKLPAKEL